MTTAERGPRKPVTIIHFPKQGKPRARPTATVTEQRAIDEVTDPYAATVSDAPMPRPSAPVNQSAPRAGRRPTPQTFRAAASMKIDKAPALSLSTPKPSAPKPSAPKPSAPKHLAPRPSTPPEKKTGRRTKTAELPPMPEAVLANVAEVKKKPRTPHEVADLATFGHQLFEMGRVDDARLIFEGLVSAGPRDGFAHTMLGTIYLALNRQDRALALFQAALKIDATDLAALVYRAEIRLNRGKARAAVEDLHRAITLGTASDAFVDRAKRLMRLAKALMGKKKK